MNSWVFGAVPKLSLAAAILFGVGLMFITSLERSESREGANSPMAKQGQQTLVLKQEQEDQRIATLERADIADYEIVFQFSLDAEFRPVDAVISARCVKSEVGDCGMIEGLNTARVDQVARMMLNRRTFEAGIRSAKIDVSRNQLLQE